MKNLFRKVTATVAALAMGVSMMGMSASAVEWQVSKSKTATNLDTNFESQITLSLPAADYKPAVDVVFVIDDTHAGSGIFAGAVENLLNELQSKENLDINIGIVTFDAVARDWLDVTSDGALSGLVPLNENFDSIVTAVNTKLSYDSEGEEKKVGATNLEWPVDMANDMLEQGTGSDKYLVMFSDMYGYVYRGDITIDDVTYYDVPLSKRIGTWDQGSLSMGTKYATFEDVYAAYQNGEGDETVDGFFRDSSWNDYWSIYYGIDPVPAKPTEGFQVGSGTFSGFEKSVGITYDRLLEASNNAHVILVNNDFFLGDAAYGQAIKNGMLDSLDEQGISIYQYSDGSLDEDVAAQIFANLRDELIQVVDAGSYVLDVIGNDFDFINNLDKIILTVGGQELEGISLEPIAEGASSYGFGESHTIEISRSNDVYYDYELHYFPNGIPWDETSNEAKQECFVIGFNVPVTRFAPVQLTYSVKLTNPSTVPGTYGQYDADGSKGYDGLHTNEAATLYWVSTNWEEGTETFNRPTVSYTVKDTTSPELPDFPDPDPKPEVSEPDEEISDPDTPLTSLPSGDTEEAVLVDKPENNENIDDEEVPEVSAPQTGRIIGGSLAALSLAAAAVVILSKKRK